MSSPNQTNGVRTPPRIRRTPIGETLRRDRLNPNRTNFASHKVSQAVVLLSRAGKQLDAACETAPDRYNADRLRSLASGLREVTVPLVKIASRLQKGCDF